MDVKQIEEFLIIARENVGYEILGDGGETTLPNGIKVLGPYKKGSLRYKDSYQADELQQFVGIEEISDGETLVWIREYQGGPIGEEHTDSMNAEKLFAALRGALRKFPRDMPYRRGPAVIEVDGYLYNDSCTGDMASFQGNEQMFDKDRKLVYRIAYGGGAVK